MRYLPAALFGVFLFGITIWDLTLPTRTMSELENRPLTAQATPTLRSIWDGSFSKRYEQLVSDQFLWRDIWIGIKSITQSALGKIENNGVVYGADGYMFEKAQALDEDQLAANIEHLVSFAQSNPGENLTLTIVPNSYAIMADYLPRGLNNIDQLSFISDIYDKTSQARWDICDISPTLLSAHQAGEYIYYRTDHHWTTWGAYLAYSEYVRGLGSEPHPWNMYDEKKAPYFYGTYHSKSLLHSAIPDVITYFDIPNLEFSINGVDKDSLYDFSKFDTRDKYSAFLQGNNAISVIKSSNPGARGSILLIKDSYGNSLAQFLAANFQEVYVADLRHIFDISEILTQKEFDQIYLIYNFSSFTSDVHIAKLHYG